MLKEQQSDLRSVENMQKIMRVFTHDLRNPLLNMQALVQEVDLAVRGHQGVADDISDTLDMLKATTNQMDDMIVGTNEIYHCMFDTLECEEVDMHEMFLRCFANLQLAEAGIELLSTAMPHVYADPLVVQRVVSELLSNAKKAIYFADNPTSNTIKVSAAVDDDMVWFFVEDCGCGFDEFEIDKVFEPFFSGHRFTYGSGMGLTRTKVWVERHGGRVNVESIASCSVVSFSLPKHKRPTQ